MSGTKKELAPEELAALAEEAKKVAEAAQAKAKEELETAEAKAKEEAARQAAFEAETARTKELNDRLEAKLAELDGAPKQAVNQPIYISKPQTEDEASESARLAKQKKDTAESEAWLNEDVTFQLFKDGKDYKEPLYVSINGKNVYIKRGVPVTMKRKYVMQIEASLIQSIKAAEYSDEQAEAYKEASKVLE